MSAVFTTIIGFVEFDAGLCQQEFDRVFVSFVAGRIERGKAETTD